MEENIENKIEEKVEEVKKHAGGRPSEYDYEKVHKLVEEYLAECVDSYQEVTIGKDRHGELITKWELRVKLPKIEGLALKLGIHKDTIYDWESKYPEFSDDVNRVRYTQADRLIDGATSGRYVPMIPKVLLTKHGYTDKIEQEVTNPDGNLKTIVINRYAGNDQSPSETN